jgi:hypothetical protein
MSQRRCLEFVGELTRGVMADPVIVTASADTHGCDENE